jgi:hypothetical protein
MGLLKTLDADTLEHRLHTPESTISRDVNMQQKEVMSMEQNMGRSVVTEQSNSVLLEQIFLNSDLQISQKMFEAFMLRLITNLGGRNSESTIQQIVSFSLEQLRNPNKKFLYGFSQRTTFSVPLLLILFHYHMKTKTLDGITSILQLLGSCSAKDENFNALIRKLLATLEPLTQAKQQLQLQLQSKELADHIWTLVTYKPFLAEENIEALFQRAKATDTHNLIASLVGLLERMPHTVKEKHLTKYTGGLLFDWLLLLNSGKQMEKDHSLLQLIFTSNSGQTYTPFLLSVLLHNSDWVTLQFCNNWILAISDNLKVYQV